jgi:hypothetical protein
MRPRRGTPKYSASRPPPPLAEHGILRAAGRADVAGHVLHHAQDRRAHLGEHRHAAADVEQRDVLRRGDDDGARQRDLLDERQRRVAGAGRQVDDEEVRRPPVHVAQELPHDAHHDRPAPDDGRLLVEEEAHRHEPDAVTLEGNDALVRRRGRARVGTEHDRDARAVDVGVHEADAVARRRERHREVRGDRRLPHAALSARHRDDVPHAGQRGALGRRVAPASRLGARDVNLDARHARQPAEHVADALAELVDDLRLVAPRPQVHAHDAVRHLQVVAHHAERDDVPPEARVEDRRAAPRAPPPASAPACAVY